MATPHEQFSDDYSLPSGVRNARLWSFFRPYLSWFVAGAFFLILTNLMTLAIPAYLGEAIEMLREAADGNGFDLEVVRADVINAALIIMALAVGAGIARVFSRITIFNGGRYIEYDLRNALYDHLSKMSAAFYSAIPTGDLTSRVTNDVTYVRLLYAIPFLHIINTLVAYVIAGYRMAQVDLFLTVVCLAPYPFLLLGVRRVIYALFLQTKVVQARLSDLSTHVQENLSGIDVIKSYVLEERETEAYGEANETYFEENLKLAKIRAMLNALIVLIASSGTLIVLIIGSRRVIDGTMTLGSFVEFNGYIVALVFPTIALGWVFAIWHRGLAAFDRVGEVLESEPQLEDPPGEPIGLPGESRRDALGKVRLSNVSFRYDDGTTALEDISLEIPAGSTVAVVGRTGSGKSTLVKLIARLYDPDTGRIEVDDVPLPKASLRQLRAEIGFVPQEPFLFSMSIGDNTRFGIDALTEDPTIDKTAPAASLLGTDGDLDDHFSQSQRIDQALEVASIRNEIESFQKGIDTLVGERGVTLSGGQKQRVTIARALLTDPRILILDDALASVDTETERQILDHLKEIMAGRTSILLTHRFNALRQVDQIFVLHEGRLVEQGTHDELIARGGHYADIYRRQKLREKHQP